MTQSGFGIDLGEVPSDVVDDNVEVLESLVDLLQPQEEPLGDSPAWCRCGTVPLTTRTADMVLGASARREIGRFIQQERVILVGVATALRKPMHDLGISVVR